MKVVVTGATGFLGRHVVRALLRLPGVAIWAVSRGPRDESDERTDPRVRAVSADVCDADSAFRDLASADVVVHLAWEALDDHLSPTHITSILPGHVRFLLRLSELGVRRVVVAGSCLEYGRREGRLSESVDAAPILPYAIAKDTLRRTVEWIAATRGLSTLWLRTFYIFGEDQRPNALVPTLRRAASSGATSVPMSPGQQVRDFLPVEDAGAIFARLAVVPGVQGILNCCSGEPRTVEAFARAYLSRLRSEVELDLGRFPYHPDEPMAFWGDATHLREALARAPELT